MLCFKNAQVIHQVALFDRAFHYGDGCFSTARVRENQIELAALHWARLSHSCDALALKANLDLIQQSLDQLQSHYPKFNGTLKIIISRGEGQRGYRLPDHPADVWCFFSPHSVVAHDYTMIEVGIAQQRIGLTMPQLLGIKSLNRLEQVLLKKEADEKSWPEALVCDIQGQIVEGISSNCFIRMNNQWVCPELRYNGVHGVMRAEILTRMQQQGIHCEQRAVAVTEHTKIQSLFFCNALHAMQIVTHLDGQQLNHQACIDLFYDLQLKQIL